MTSKKKPAGTPICPYVGKFLKFWLPEVLHKSKHTVRSYMGMFKSLNAYMKESYGLAPMEVCFESLDEETLTGYLSWLVDVRGLKVSSVNTRLGALKAFGSYIQIENPAEATFCISVSKLKLRKVADELVKFLEVEAIEALFREASKKNLRDLAILQTLYATGAREAEFLSLTVYDVRFNRDGTANIVLVGKGNKARTVKVGSAVSSVLKAHVHNNVGTGESLFCNRRGESLSPSGLTYVLNKYAKIVHRANPALVPEKIHPHMFRHSIATHMLRAGVDLENIRLFLGHSSIAATMIYAKSDPAAVSEAVLVVEEGLIKENSLIMPKEKKGELDRWLAEEYSQIAC